MKICLIIPSLQAGGMERVMSELMKYFASRHQKLDLHLVLYGRKRDVFYNIPENIIVHKPSFEFEDSRRFFFTLKTLWFLRKRIVTINPDTTLSFGEYWNNFVLLALFGLPYPVFVSDRCQPDKSLGKLHTILRKYLYHNAKGIIAQTEKAKELYGMQFKHQNVKVIGNPIRCINKKDQTIEPENIVLSVGRLIKSKNYDKLIEMFVHINRPGWKLVIVGDDALKQQNMKRLKELVKQLDAEDKVFLVGRQLDVENYYLKSKIFAFTSSSEGFPNVIGEALSAGLPVVSFDCVAGPSEMVQDEENGFLIPLFDYSFFEKRLKCLMDNSVLLKKLGENAKQSIKKFSVESIGEQFYKFITSKG